MNIVEEILGFLHSRLQCKRIAFVVAFCVWPRLSNYQLPSTHSLAILGLIWFNT